MKTEIEQLIDRLADKSLSFGCFGRTVYRDNAVVFVNRNPFRKDMNDWLYIVDGRVCTFGKNEVQVLGHDIMIGDILELIEKKRWGASVRDLINIPNSATIIDLWTQCRTPSDVENRKTGLTKSLQEIIASTEWEEAECDEPRCKNGHYPLGMTEDGEIDWGACPKCKPLEGKALFPKSPTVERLVGNLLSLDL